MPKLINELKAFPPPILLYKLLTKVLETILIFLLCSTSKIDLSESTQI